MRVVLAFLLTLMVVGTSVYAQDFGCVSDSCTVTDNKWTCTYTNCTQQPNFTINQIIKQQNITIKNLTCADTTIIQAMRNFTLEIINDQNESTKILNLQNQLEKSREIQNLCQEDLGRVSSENSKLSSNVTQLSDNMQTAQTRIVTLSNDLETETATGWNRFYGAIGLLIIIVGVLQYKHHRDVNSGVERSEGTEEVPTEKLKLDAQLAQEKERTKAAIERIKELEAKNSQEKKWEG